MTSVNLHDLSMLSAEARVALTLRLLGGLTTSEIARAFLVPEPTIAQRIVRAKKTLSNAGVPFEVPRGAERLRITPSPLHDDAMTDALVEALVAIVGSRPELARDHVAELVLGAAIDAVELRVLAHVRNKDEPAVRDVGVEVVAAEPTMHVFHDRA